MWCGNSADFYTDLSVTEATHLAEILKGFHTSPSKHISISSDLFQAFLNSVDLAESPEEFTRFTIVCPTLKIYKKLRPSFINFIEQNW